VDSNFGLGIENSSCGVTVGIRIRTKLGLGLGGLGSSG
jgi:hypothetical protein